MRKSCRILRWSVRCTTQLKYYIGEFGYTRPAWGPGRKDANVTTCLLTYLRSSTYTSAFEQYAQFLKAEYPGISVEGAFYHPHRLIRVLSNVVFYGKFAAMAAVIAGPTALQAVGINNPPTYYMWAHENKVHT